MSSRRCGSIFGTFTANSGRITEECDTSRTRITHRVAVRAKDRTLFVRFPYYLNPAHGLLSQGDRLSGFAAITNAGREGVPYFPRFDWSTDYRLTFTVGR